MLRDNMIVVHEFWQRFPPTHYRTDILALLVHALAHRWRLHYANDAGAQRQRHAKYGMLYWWLHYTVCSEGMLYRVQHVGRTCCEAMAEWVMFEVDLWNVDCLSSANIFRLGHCVKIGVQRDSFPAPEVRIFALQKHSEVSSSSAQRLFTFVLARGEKSIGQALLLDGFLRKLGSHNLQTAVLFRKYWSSIHLPSW